VAGGAIHSARPVLRIFISSTAVDLLDYRDKVRDAVLRLESLPIAMETFSAQSGQPVGECMRMAAAADAVICIVAHRYGYVPPPELGGDGERSITWLEVDAAKGAGKPVFAFLVDPKAPWTELKEQDRLVSEPEKAQEIFKAVQKLQEFKAYLEQEFTRQTFTGPEDLDAKVTAALANFTPAQGQALTSTARVWQPLFCHALQPAQHFRGRQIKRQDLKEWLQAAVTPDRVVSLVAAGWNRQDCARQPGSSRDNALGPRRRLCLVLLRRSPYGRLPPRSLHLFHGRKGHADQRMLERLRLALSGDAPHVLVLDGLERVQSDDGRRRRGELEDQQLKRLVRALAGGVGSTRALVTSRFPLVDLDEWTGAGHRAILLDDLELPVALEVLRAWKVKGTDDALTRMIEPLNIGSRYHALSVALLGSYLGNFVGDAPTFSLDDAKETDPKARRLARILEQYEKVLTAVERDLLARLSLFPRGLKVELLGSIVQSGGEVAGALIGLADHQLAKHLEKLRALGLVFRYATDGQIIYSAHPFLRNFFRIRLGTKPESVHESVRAKLAASLEERPSAAPSDPAILDQYELLIEQTLLAGRVHEAFDLFWYGLGGYQHLDWVLGENGRGRRILERFVPQNDFTLIQPLPLRVRSALVCSLGVLARSQGDLATARRALSYSLGLDHSVTDWKNVSQAYQHLALAELPAGNFAQALEYSEGAVSLSIGAYDQSLIVNSPAYRATARFALDHRRCVPIHWAADTHGDKSEGTTPKARPPATNFRT
jgi:tetratricopeptide (TPR) repeat protein